MSEGEGLLGEEEGEAVGFAVVGVEVGASGEFAENCELEGCLFFKVYLLEQCAYEAAVALEEEGTEGGYVFDFVADVPTDSGVSGISVEVFVKIFLHQEGETLVIFV